LLAVVSEKEAKVTVEAWAQHCQCPQPSLVNAEHVFHSGLIFLKHMNLRQAGNEPALFQDVCYVVLSRASIAQAIAACFSESLIWRPSNTTVSICLFA
jgi:hypothetical protein